MRYLTSEQILLIHSIVIDETGGSHGLRDRNGLQSAVGLPQQTFDGTELYASPFAKAAVYARSIIASHPFVDGNKRTGMVAASVFLENNGYRIIAERGEIERCALRIVRDKLSVDAIAVWFQEHTTKRSTL